MKLTHLAFAAILVAAPAGAATAQTAAATLPNTFDAPRASPAVPAPQGPSAAQAPDIARAEEALRAVIAAAQAGQLDYAAFTDDLGVRMRTQEDRLLPVIQSFGALQTIGYVGQESGAALFRIVFANQNTEWLIAFSPDDRIAALLFRPAAA